MSSRKYLLIISCGKKKSEELQEHALKAEDAYKGPLFQVINKAKRENRWPKNLELGIISAYYGFLRSSDQINNYDLKMTKSIAKNLRLEIIEKIQIWHESEAFSHIYVLMGKEYLTSIDGLQNVIESKITIENMGGLGIGQRKLLDFLNSINISSLGK